jgi:hypothetical protein
MLKYNIRAYIGMVLSSLSKEKLIVFYAGSEVLTALAMKGSVFWDIRPRSSLKVKEPFEGTCCLYRQSRRISQARNWHETGIKLEDGGNMFFFETSVVFHRATRRYIPQERTLQIDFIFLRRPMNRVIQLVVVT